MYKKILLYCGVTLLVAGLGFGAGYFYGTAFELFFNTDTSTLVRAGSAVDMKSQPEVIKPSEDEKPPELAKDEFKIGDIRLGEAKPQIFRTLGNPVKTGVVLHPVLQKKVTVLYYTGIEVSLDELGTAIEITGTAIEFTGPREISVGMNRLDVEKKLGKPDKDQNNTLVYSSDEDQHDKLSVKTNNGFVISLSVSHVD